MKHTFEFADPVYQVGDFFIKFRANNIFWNAGVFDHIMEQCGNQALMIHMHIGENGGNGQWVGNICLT